MNESKIKVLVITYYWPPAGGSGVQRWLKFVKYLRDFGIEPIVYTVDTDHLIQDKTLLKEIPEGIEVIKRNIKEPQQILSLFGGNSKKQGAGFLESKPSLAGRIMRYIRANFFVPDARKYWVKPSVRFLESYLKRNPVDVVITSGPPHSLHLIGMELKSRLKIKWISDFRDPWTNIDYFHKLPLTKKSFKRHQYLEKLVVENSDRVLVVGNTMKKEFLSFNKEIDILTNGFDTNQKKGEFSLDEKFSITHVGMMNADRNPKILWRVLANLCKENKAFCKTIKIHLIGKIAEVVREDLKIFEDHQVDITDYLSHTDIVSYQCASQVLLLSINRVPFAKGIITGKIFEYLQAKRPILAIGPEDGDAAYILRNTNAGKIFDFKEEMNLKQYISVLFEQYKKGNTVVNSKNIDAYHRKNITEDLARIIKKTICQA